MKGAHLGPYHVLAELGSGGMGKVYRAELTREAAGLDAGTAVAIKVIHAHLLEQEGFFQRFLREADIGRSVHHENVVRTYVADALMLDGAQQNFLVMEYVEGQTLRDLLDELERVPEEFCRHIGSEIAKGLDAIHEAGVVHRDLKPENVLITADHVVKVMDLGIARLQDEAIRLSQTGAFVGSLEYAAPEQFRSSDGEPDGRADLYSLGVLLYELSTGQHPYRDEDVSKVFRHILDEQPRKAGEINPQLSAFFEEMLQTLIAKDREQRFSAASELAAVLEEGEKSDWWKERAKALRIETKRPLRRIRIPRETALCGRDDDLARLRSLFDKAKSGDGQVLLIEGEAGIGKTRLVDEFVGRLHQEGEDINFLFGSYPPGGAATAAGAFSEAYREQFGQEGSAPWLSQTPILVPAFDALLRGEPAPKDAEALTKDSLGTVFVHATRNLAAERPTIVLIDDLHFAPEDARSLFMTLALAVPELRLLLVGTMRPGLDEAWISNLTRLDQASHATLSRLGPKDLARLLKGAFRSERLAQELGLKIAEKSDGNPFFAFEIIRGLREGQFISQQPDGTWVSTQVIEGIEIPSSVTDLIQARLGDLSEEERDLLNVASCCGFEFDPLVVATVQGLAQIPAMKLFARIEKQHRLVRSQGRRFAFDHHQVQEALYTGMPELLREPYHAAIAEALESREQAADKDPKVLDGSFCVDLCEHFLKGALGDRALRYLDAALDHLVASYLNDQAIGLADRALDPPGLLKGTRRVQVLLRKASCLNLLGRRLAQAKALEEAHALAAEGIDAELESPLQLALGALAWSESAFNRAVEHQSRACERAHELGDTHGECKAAVGLGHSFHRLGRQDEARIYYQRGLELARACDDRSMVAYAQMGLGNVSFALGSHKEAMAQTAKAIEMCRQAADLYGEALAEGNLGNALDGLGRREEALEHQRRSLRLAESIGVRYQQAGALLNLGSCLKGLGRLDEAVPYYERSLRMSREICSANAAAIALVNLGDVWREVGDLRRAREALDESLGICREIGARYPEGYALLWLAMLADEEEQAEEARRLARASLDLRREIGHGDGVAGCLRFLGDLERRAGSAQEARAALEEALGLDREQGRKAEVAHVLALLARLPEGDAAAAEKALEEAGPVRNTIEIRYHLWRATGLPEHLAESKRLLDFRVEHAPEDYRESMLKNVRLYREIMKAWGEHEAADA